MHQLGNHHRLRQDVAAMLADVGFEFFAVLGIVGLLDGLGFRQFRGVRTAFRAGEELLILASVLTNHNLMAVGATVRREFQSLQLVFQGMDFGQGETAVLLQLCMALRALEIMALFQPFLENEAVKTAQPRCRPCGNLGAWIVQRLLVHRLRADGLTRQLVGHLQGTMVLAVTNPREVQKQGDNGYPIVVARFLEVGENDYHDGDDEEQNHESGQAYQHTAETALAFPRRARPSGLETIDIGGSSLL